jgi:co-chaperonin GroES (HSP10)
MMGEVAFEAPQAEVEAELPLLPVGWRVLVRPYEPDATYGETGIAIANEALESEKLLSYVGQIVAMGSECFKAVTRSGIELANIDPKPKVGDWIVYGTYGGQRIRMKNGTDYLLMNDDGIMALIDDPRQFRAYL